MTCKDCYHYEACSGYLISDLDKDVWDYCAKGKTDEIPDIEDRCSEFKNKADVVEVVRCKDCEHLRIINGKGLYAYCPKTECKFMPFEIDTRTHYCSYGNRKEGAEE